MFIILKFRERIVNPKEWCVSQLKYHGLLFFSINWNYIKIGLKKTLILC